MQPEETPAKLLCETCGVATIDVVVVWLQSGDNSLSCMPCFLATAVKMVQEMAAEAEAAEA